VLLLLFASQPGTLVAAAATLALSAPPATLDADAAGTGVVLDASPCTITLSAPAAAPTRVLQASPNTITLSAPTAVRDVTGTVTLSATPNTITLSNGTAGISIDLTATTITINGVPRERFIRPQSLTVTDNLNEAPNLATFVCHGFVPVPGQEIVIAIGTASNREFAGHLTAVEQVYESKPANVAYHCEALDYTRLFDRRLVHGRYPAQSVTTTVQQVIATYCAGFSAAQVATGLPAIAEIDFDWEPPTRVLSRLAELIGGYWYVDYNRVVHFFITETADAPDPIVGPNAHVQTLARRKDNTQNRTMVFVTGQGTQLTADLPAGVGQLPVEDVTPFAAGGGLARIDGLQLSYTGIYAGGRKAEVKGAPAPTAAPTASIVAGAGGVLGATDYRVSFKSEAGETAPGPASNGVTGTGFGPPGGVTISVAPAAGVGRLAGTFGYRTTYVTDRGETDIAATAGSGITFVAAPVAPAGVVTINPGGSLNVNGALVGAYRYRYAFVTPFGESLPSTVTTRTATAAAHSTNPNGSQGSGLGHLTGGGAVYRWAETAVTQYGETLIGPVSSPVTMVSPTAPTGPSGVTLQAGGAIPTGQTVQYAVVHVAGDGSTSNASPLSSAVTPTAGNQQVLVTGIPFGPTGTVLRRIYRKRGSGALGYVGQLENNLDTSYTDDQATTGATAPTSSSLSVPASVLVRFITLSNGATAGILARRVYRTKANGSAYYLVAEVSGNAGDVTITDDVPDSALTVAAPVVATAGGDQHDLAIPTGPTGTLARRIYRSTGGGTEDRLLVEIQDNATTTWRDNVPDSGLGSEAPALVSTAGGQNAVLTVQPGASGTLARRIYRTKAGGSTYYLAGQVNGNALDTFLDSKVDDELGEAGPGFNTAGASAVLVASIPLGPSGTTARRIYRRDSALVYRFVAELRDNATATYLDDLGEDELGDVAPTVSTIGATEGASVLLLDDVTPFYAGPEGGWAFLGSTPIHYAAISGNTLTGIPSLENPVRVGTEIEAAPMLQGVTALPYKLPAGTRVRILVIRESPSGQAAMAAIEGGDGVHQHMVEDDLLTIASATTRGDAELLQFASDEHRVTFSGRDPKWRSGKTISINIGPPTNVVGTFKIQQVVITEWGIPRTLPLRTVVASSVLYSFEHLLRRVELGA
jgi:hypothetical protein